jgi:hypothetical protein
MRSTHREMRCSAAVQDARYRAARCAAMRSAPCEIRPGESIFNGNRREDIWLDNK